MTLLAAEEPLGIYAGGNSKQDLPQQTFSSMPAPSGFAQAQKQGGDCKHPLPLLKRGFCNLLGCCWAQNQKVEEAGIAESSSLSLFCCKTHLGLWGFQYEEASGPAPLQDGGQGHNTVLPRVPFTPHTGKGLRRAQGTEEPSSFDSSGGGVGRK